MLHALCSMINTIYKLHTLKKLLENEKFYEEIVDDLNKETKVKNDKIVNSMLEKNEIPIKVAEFLQGGKCQMANYYHLMKTHKIPTAIENPEEWLSENGFPIRGIVSGIGTPTERLSGFVDFFLQPGMKQLDSFLKDGKHTLQIIEETNDKIRAGELSLDGVALVSLDVEAMYNNMTRELGTLATKQYLEGRTFQQGGEGKSVSSESILEALDLCLDSNVFKFNEKIFKQVGGVGTGLKLSPTYACLGMGNYEKIVFNSNHDLLKKIILWKRFIDDILMMFKGSRDECEALV